MKVILILLGCLLALLASPGPLAAQTGDGSRVLALVNQARVSAGLAPLVVSPQLTASAQAHANDMLRNGVGIGHYGSDHSTPATRIMQAGYHSYSWGPFVGENWAAYQTVDVSMGFWMSDAPHRDNILRPGFREIGIGVAYLPEGFPILVTDFGAQPNVLPISVSGSGTSVSVTLSNEDAAPAGDGPNVIGQTVQVDLSPYADMSQAQTVPFARTVQLNAPDGRPISTVYARFHDAAGRTVVSAASISGQWVAPAAAVTNTPFIPPTATPTRTRTRTPRPTSTRTRVPPTATRTASPTATATASSTPTATPSPTVTNTEIVHAGVATVAAPAETGNAVPDSALAGIAQNLFGLAAMCAFVVLLIAGWNIWRGKGML